MADWQEQVDYSDGAGTVVQTLVQAEDGLVPERDVNGALVYDGAGALQWVQSTDRWIGTGRLVVNNKGKPIKQYEPFFTEGPTYETERDLVDWGVNPTLSYDAAGRYIRTDLPDGTYPQCSTDSARCPHRRRANADNRVQVRIGERAGVGPDDPGARARAALRRPW